MPLSDAELTTVDVYWRAANYLSVGQIYLTANPLLSEPLRPEHIKPRLLGHWGTTPGLNLVYAHLNRVIRQRDLDMMSVIGPGHGGRGAGRWDWASNDDGDPDVVLGCAGDVPTMETLAAVSLLRERLPDLAIRVVNVVDLMRLQTDTEHPHGMSDAEFDALFTADKPIIFAYHGYPWLIHRLTYRRRNHGNLHVRGYIEEGTTTTPFDMVVLNNLDRFHLAMDVIDRVPRLRTRAVGVRQELADMRVRHRAHVTSTGEDLPEVRDWRWAC